MRKRGRRVGAAKPVRRRGFAASRSAGTISGANAIVRKRGRARPKQSFDGAGLPRRVRKMTDKRQIRATARAARAAFAATNPPALAPPPQFTALLTRGLTVASYVPVGSEADPSPLARAAVSAGCVIVLPHVVDRATPLRFLAWDTEAALATGPFGLHQPAADAAEYSPDIILTPLVAFDAALNRIGQGAGHYDRAFVTFPAAKRIGVAWSAQHVAAIPADPWDVPLHAIVTEQGWLTR